MDAETPHIIEFKRIADPRGNLSVITHPDGCPFPIRRVFYIYDIPADAMRGGHAHHVMNELIIAVSGCFDVEVTDGKSTRLFTLRRPNEGLLLPAGFWRSLSGFSSGSVCLTLCDTDFDEADYIRDFNEYLQIKKVAANE